MDDTNKDEKVEGDGKEPVLGWFDRQGDLSNRLTEIMRQFNNPDGRSMDGILKDLAAVTEEVKNGPRPSPEEIARFRQKPAPEKKERLREIFSGITGRLSAMSEEMNKPSALDLSSAIMEGDLDEVRRLLDAGVSPLSLSSTGDSMLKTALIFKQHDIAALLRERGAVYGMIEATLAGDVAHLTVLLDEGAAVNRSDKTGTYALSAACERGYTEVVRLLLARGANPNQRNKMGHRPLASACISGFPTIAHLLVDAGTAVGVVEAAYLGDLPLLKRLLAEGAEKEIAEAEPVTPLIAASGCGHVEVAQFLLERGAAPNQEMSSGVSALGWAVSHEHVPVIHLLIDHGADPNGANKRFGSTPLMNAAMSGKLRAVEVLLARGADPNFTDPESEGLSGRKPPLHQCIFGTKLPRFSSSDIPVRIATLLLDAGANIEAQDKLGYTPLMHAARAGNAALVRLFLSRGANIHVSAQKGYATPLSCTRETDAPKDRRDKSEVRTLIMEALGPEYAVYDAAEQGDVPRLTALLDAGAPADEGIQLMPGIEDSEHLKADDFKEPPLGAAAIKGHIEAVRVLLARDDISQSSKNLALTVTEFQKQEEIAQLLREAGAVNTPKRR